MDRQAVGEKYHMLFEQSCEKSAEWYVYGYADALLGSRGDLVWIRGEVVKAQDRSLQYALEHGHRPDYHYGTYGVYMQTKADLYGEVLRDVDSLCAHWHFFLGLACSLNAWNRKNPKETEVTF